MSILDSEKTTDNLCISEILDTQDTPDAPDAPDISEPDVCWTNTGYKTDFTFCLDRALDYISLVTKDGWLYDLETGKLQTVDIVLKHRLPHQTTVTASLIIRCIECKLFSQAHDLLSKYNGDKEEIYKIAVQYGMVENIIPRKSLVPFVWLDNSHTSLRYFKNFLTQNLPTIDIQMNLWFLNESHKLAVRPFKPDLFTHKYISNEIGIIDKFVDFLLEAPKASLRDLSEIITKDDV